jgi:hypothetical protein
LLVLGAAGVYALHHVQYMRTAGTDATGLTLEVYVSNAAAAAANLRMTVGAGTAPTGEYTTATGSKTVYTSDGNLRLVMTETGGVADTDTWQATGVAQYLGPAPSTRTVTE